MAFDPHKNFAYSTLTNAPSTGGTSFVVQSGDTSKFPAASFNATVWPAGAQPTSANAEIVRVTSVNAGTNTFTVTRNQESSTNRNVAAGDQIAATVTAKLFTDIETQLAPLASPALTGSVTASGTVNVGVNTAVSSSLLIAINPGNSIEFGHNNASGYRGTLGADYSAGNNFLAFHGEAGTTANTYRTRGVKATILRADGSGGLQVGNVASTNADNQSFVTQATVSSAGVISATTGIAGPTATSLPGSPVNGQVQTLRLGSSPYDFITLTYDSTWGHWVSDAQSQGGNAGTVLFPQQGIYYSAGLTLQARWGAFYQSGGSGQAIMIAYTFGYTSYVAGSGPEGYYGWYYAGNTPTSAAADGNWRYADTGWVDVQPTGYDVLKIEAYADGNGNGFSINSAFLSWRWRA